MHPTESQKSSPPEWSAHGERGAGTREAPDQIEPALCRQCAPRCRANEEVRYLTEMAAAPSLRDELKPRTELLPGEQEREAKRTTRSSRPPCFFPLPCPSQTATAPLQPCHARETAWTAARYPRGCKPSSSLKALILRLPSRYRRRLRLRLRTRTSDLAMTVQISVRT